MKKTILVLSILAFALVGYAQVTPGGSFRISARTTPLGQNIPVGVTIFAIADSTFWITKAGCSSAFTINTASAAGKIMQIIADVDWSAGALFSESYELSTPDGASKSILLSHNPIDTTSISVSLNGLELKRTANFWCRTLTDSTITIRVPCYQYDKVLVSYMTKYSAGVLLWEVPVIEE
jgi:hypothetical protein